ncbi:MAG TPA: FkbM family methyltransferase [Verrucomicrobiae bacterium]|jgi:FkbM family methyltransferase|nr:FkbM family methyltransferase [Verrucomicrobiae bacterium]
MTALMPAIAPHWRARKNYAGMAGWMIHIYNRLLRRTPQLPLPGRSRAVSVWLKDRRHPFFVRLGSTDMLVLDEMFHAREYSFVEESLRGVHRIVDLGANVGFSLRYWNEVFPGAKILAVEPEPENFNLCRRNVEAGGFADAVELVRACVGSHRRLAHLSGGDAWAYQMSSQPEAGAPSVPVVPLSELLETHFPCGQIDLLKCDIEGAERELFADCASWISRFKAIVIELHPPYSTAELFSDLNRAGAQFDLVREFSEKQCPVLLLRSRAS